MMPQNVPIKIDPTITSKNLSTKNPIASALNYLEFYSYSF